MDYYGNMSLKDRVWNMLRHDMVHGIADTSSRLRSLRNRINLYGRQEKRNLKRLEDFDELEGAVFSFLGNSKAFLQPSFSVSILSQTLHDLNKEFIYVNDLNHNFEKKHPDFSAKYRICPTITSMLESVRRILHFLRSILSKEKLTLTDCIDSSLQVIQDRIDKYEVRVKTERPHPETLIEGDTFTITFAIILIISCLIEPGVFTSNLKPALHITSRMENDRVFIELLVSNKQILINKIDLEKDRDIELARAEIVSYCQGFVGSVGGLKYSGLVISLKTSK